MSGQYGGGMRRVRSVRGSDEACPNSTGGEGGGGERVLREPSMLPCAPRVLNVNRCGLGSGVLVSQRSKDEKRLQARRKLHLGEYSKVSGRENSRRAGGRGGGV